MKNQSSFTGVKLMRADGVVLADMLKRVLKIERYLQANIIFPNLNRQYFCSIPKIIKHYFLLVEHIMKSWASVRFPPRRSYSL